MANHKSAEKRHRQSLKHNEANRMQKSAFKTAIRRALEAVSAKADKPAVDEALRKATSLLDKAAIHGVIHKNTAARKISRLYRFANKFSSVSN